MDFYVSVNMALLNQTPLLKVSQIGYQLLNELHVSSTICIYHKWREEKKLPQNPNSFGPLTNLPDYSFANGKPVPYGSNQKRRIDAQRGHLVRIQELAGEIDYAVERHARIQKEIQEKKQRIIDSKLKEKGKVLLTSGSAEQ